MTRDLLLLGICLFALSVDGQTNCPSNMPYECANGEKCYSAIERCNSILDCQDGSDETANCTTQVKPVPRRHEENLAWLITPILFLLGVAYAIYKCIKDGVCGAIKRRIVLCIRGDVPRASDFHPLHQVSFSTSTRIPCTYSDVHGNPILPSQGTTLRGQDPRRMMVVRHDQQFSFMFQDGRMVSAGVHNPRRPPPYEEALQDPSGSLMVQQAGMLVAPSYKDASTLPSYMEAIGERNDSSERRGSGVVSIDEIDEDEDEDENHDNMGCDERESLMRPNVLKNSRESSRNGRRRHHSQWNGGSDRSGSGGSAFRRRHHSQP